MITILKNNRLLSIYILLSLLIVVIIVCYFDIIFWMIERYLGEDSYYSHGFLVPFITGFLIWKKRKLLKTKSTKHSMLGIVLILLAGTLHIFGTILYVFSLSAFSIIILIIGIVLFLWGKDITKCIWFPLVYLFFMIPLPMAIISLISFPLKMFAVEIGAWLVRIANVPVYKEGFNIFIPAGRLLVGNPCSGLRSLIAFLAIGAVISYISHITIYKKLTLFFLSIPIALLSNITRIFILIVASHIWGLQIAKPDTILHTGSGIFVFIIGIIFLFIANRVIEWRA